MMQSNQSLNLIGEFVEKVQRIQNLEGLDIAFNEIMRKFCFDKYAYQLVKNEQYKKPDPLILASYPEEWVRYYLGQAYHKLDPVIIEGPKKRLPFTWSSMWEGIELNKKQKAFFNEAEEFSVANGLGFPIPGPNGSFAMVTMAAANDDAIGVQRIFEENQQTLHILSLYYHQAVCELLAKKENFLLNVAHEDLSPRELEILKWCAAHKSNWEVGMILKISENTVRHHLKNILLKFKVSSKHEAVVRAIMLGLIKP